MEIESLTEHWLSRLIASNGGIFQTLNDIKIYAYPDGSLHLFCEHPEKVPPESDVELVIRRTYSNCHNLTDSLAIACEEDLQNLTPQRMLLKYKNGEADILAYLEQMDYVLDLTFRVKRTATFISDNDTGDIWKHNSLVLTAAGIICCVRQYAKDNCKRLRQAKVFKL